MAVAAPQHSALAEHVHHAPKSFINRYIFTLDHKIIGLQYMITGSLFFIISGLLA
jgi:cytochrome c oxidase subunit 1